MLTLGYQSSSYLTDRVPALGFVDLPFLFQDNAQARAAIDGALGQHLADQIEARVNYRILGFFENGFRQVSNRLRPVRSPHDLAGMKIRVLPSDVQARTFQLLGAEPVKMDLTEAIERVVDGSLDAQENPLANTVTYGVHKLHRFHTLTNHFYISRPIFTHRDTIDGWPNEVKAELYEAVRDSITYQRGLAEQEAVAARKAIVARISSRPPMTGPCGPGDGFQPLVLFGCDFNGQTTHCVLLTLNKSRKRIHVFQNTTN